MTVRRVPLSVLDLIPVPVGSSEETALQNSLHLVRKAEAAGYRRFWFAEHHFNPGVLGSSPALLIALAGAVTNRIRLGSGAVQLGHRSATSVAEEFGLLSTAFPGRIDLGLGRSGGRPPSLPEPPPGPSTTPEGLLLPAPFTDWAALIASPRFAAQRKLLSFPGAEPQSYDEQVGVILDFLHGKHTVDGVDLSVPTGGHGGPPQVWVLGSSAGESARVAGARGLPFAANYHVAPASVVDAVAAYRNAFRASEYLPAPWVQVSADVLVADTDDRAADLASGYGQWVHSIRTGAGAIRYPTPVDARRSPLTGPEAALVADRLDTRFVGSPSTVTHHLEVLQRATGADELLITTITHDHADRVRSYQLLAEAWAD